MAHRRTLLRAAPIAAPGALIDPHTSAKRIGDWRDQQRSRLFSHAWKNRAYVQKNFLPVTSISRRLQALLTVESIGKVPACGTNRRMCTGVPERTAHRAARCHLPCLLATKRRWRGPPVGAGFGSQRGPEPRQIPRDFLLLWKANRRSVESGPTPMFRLCLSAPAEAGIEIFRARSFQP